MNKSNFQSFYAGISGLILQEYQFIALINAQWGLARSSSSETLSEIPSTQPEDEISKERSSPDKYIRSTLYQLVMIGNDVGCHGLAFLGQKAIQEKVYKPLKFM
jgi:hypothetical protein